jgi:hypothetical protein
MSDPLLRDLQIADRTYGSPHDLFDLLRLAGREYRAQQPTLTPANNGSIPAATRDPDFRQLSRMVRGKPTDSASGQREPGEGASPESSKLGDSSEPLPIVTAGLGQIPGRLPFPPIGPVPGSSNINPQLSEFWRKVRGFWEFMLPRVSPGMPGGGGDEFIRCLRAASGTTEDWEAFCRSMDFGMSKTVGGEAAKRACWSKTHESERNKTNWCDNQFGNFPSE